MQEHRLQTAEQAEAFYRKREKKAAPAGWEAFNNKTLFKAYEKRAANLPVDLEVSLDRFLASLVGSSSKLISPATSPPSSPVPCKLHYLDIESCVEDCNDAFRH